VSHLGVAGWALIAAAPIVGSFLGVVVRRLPDGRPIVWARSCCEACGAVLQPRDLVPLVSWVAAQGRCRHCGRPLGWFYPAIELGAVAVALLAVATDDVPRAALDCILGWWLLMLGWVDLRRWVLPDALTLPLLAAGLAASATLEPETVLDRAVGAVLGYLALRAVAIAYRGLRGRGGLGGGDAKLLAAAGAWVGALALPQVVLGAALAGLAAAAVMRMMGVRLNVHSALPFGPFLALATWVVWQWGPVPL
jgi:leader peptidase (prepilin peptidase) / N-methyltransferase